MHQDEINKRLFSEPRMIKDLLEAFFDQSFTNELDFTTLTRVNSSFISLKSSPETSSLIRAFTVYLSNRLDMNESTADIQIDTITEVNTMLRETVQQWKRDFYNEGLDQGLSQGRYEGERAVIERLLIHKFGELMPTYQQKLRQLSEKQLLSISEKILFASSLEQVFAEKLTV